MGSRLLPIFVCQTAVVLCNLITGHSNGNIRPIITNNALVGEWEPIIIGSKDAVFKPFFPASDVAHKAPSPLKPTTERTQPQTTANTPPMSSSVSEPGLTNNILSFLMEYLSLAYPSRAQTTTAAGQPVLGNNQPPGGQRPVVNPLQSNLQPVETTTVRQYPLTTTESAFLNALANTIDTQTPRVSDFWSEPGLQWEALHSKQAYPTVATDINALYSLPPTTATSNALVVGEVKGRQIIPSVNNLDKVPGNEQNQDGLGKPSSGKQRPGNSTGIKQLDQSPSAQVSSDKGHNSQSKALPSASGSVGSVSGNKTETPGWMNASWITTEEPPEKQQVELEIEDPIEPTGP